MNVSWPSPEVARLDQVDGARLLSQFAVCGDERTLLLDAGLPETPGAGTIPFLEQHKRLACPLALVITHLDADHCGGTANLRHCVPHTAVIAHARECPPLGDPEATIRQRYSPFSTSDCIVLEEGVRHRIRSRLGSQFQVDVLLMESCDLSLGNVRCVILHVPGHSAGHLSLWLPQSGTLIAGDAFMGTGIRSLDNRVLFPPQFIRPSLYRASIEIAKKLDPETLLCAHEKTMRSHAVSEYLSDSLRAAEMIVELVTKSIRGRVKSLLDICQDVKKSNDDWAEVAIADFAMTVAGCLADMEEEGRLAVRYSGSVRTFEGSDR